MSDNFSRLAHKPCLHRPFILTEWHTSRISQGTNSGEVKSLHPVEKILESGMLLKQLASCPHEQVHLVLWQHVGCRNLFQLCPKTLIRQFPRNSSREYGTEHPRNPIPRSITDKLAQTAHRLDHSDMLIRSLLPKFAWLWKKSSLSACCRRRHQGSPPRHLCRLFRPDPRSA